MVQCRLPKVGSCRLARRACRAMRCRVFALWLLLARPRLRVARSALNTGARMHLRHDLDSTRLHAPFRRHDHMASGTALCGLPCLFGLSVNCSLIQRFTALPNGTAYTHCLAAPAIRRRRTEQGRIAVAKVVLGGLSSRSLGARARSRGPSTFLLVSVGLGKRWILAP